MIRMENDCYGCNWPGGCGGCSRKDNYAVVYCDECGEQLDEHAYTDGEHECLCQSCAEKYGAFDEDGDLTEDWDRCDVCDIVRRDEESAYDAYCDRMYDEYKDRQLEERMVG